MGDHYDEHVPESEAPEHDDTSAPSAPSGASRRDFLKTSAAFAAGAAASQLRPRASRSTTVS